MKRIHLALLLGAIINFGLFFLLYLYLEKDTISSSLRMALIITVVNTIILYTGLMNWQVMIVNRTDEDKLYKIIEHIGGVKIKERDEWVKYRLTNRRWPFNTLRLNKTEYYNIYLSTNFATLKKIQHEMEKEDLL